jgi:hypothetical protein
MVNRSVFWLRTAESREIPTVLNSCGTAPDLYRTFPMRLEFTFALLSYLIKLGCRSHGRGCLSATAVNKELPSIRPNRLGKHT